MILSSRVLRWARLFDAGVRRLRRAILPAEMVVFEDATAPWLTSALGTACRLELPVRVPSTGGRVLTDLASELGVETGLLRRLLRMLVAHGYFHLSDDETAVSHNRLSRSLERGRAGSFCLLQADSWYRDCFAGDRAARALASGVVPFDSIAGNPFFEFAKADSNAGTLFSDAMAEISRFCAPLLADALPLVRGAKVLDVGGGNGEFCRTLSAHHPGVSFSVLDMEDHPDRDGVAHFQGCFFERLPGGFDHLLLKNILHDWDDERAIAILENCRQASTKLSVIELVLPERAKPGVSAADFSVDWNVHCTLGGSERTLSEYRALFQRTGWELEGLVATATPLWILQATAL